MKDFRQFGMTKKELLEKLNGLNDDDVITFGNGLPNGNLLTFYRIKLMDDSNPKSLIHNFQFNELITGVAV
jgi:hypothetical protein